MTDSAPAPVVPPTGAEPPATGAVPSPVAGASRSLVARQPSPPTYTFGDLERMAESVSKSGFFKLSKDAAVTLMMIAHAEGRHPVHAAMDYDIIEGKPALKAKKLLGRFLDSGGKVEWRHRDETKCHAVFSHPLGIRTEVNWTMARAAKIQFYKRDRAGDGGKWHSLTEKHNWKNYPTQMLQWRAVSEGVDACYPQCSTITLTVEDARDGAALEIDGDFVRVPERPPTELDQQDEMNQSAQFDERPFLAGKGFAAMRDEKVSELYTRFAEAKTEIELDEALGWFTSQWRVSRAVWGAIQEEYLRAKEQLGANEAHAGMDEAFKATVG